MQNVELAILATLVLASNELKPEKVLADAAMLFDPHLPGATWNSVYARMDQVSPLYHRDNVIEFIVE